MEWMVWTLPTAILFIAIFALLGFMTLIGLRAPVLARKGFLPMTTTRGDRLYVGMLGVVLINLIWIGVTDSSQWFAVGVSTVWLYVVMRFG
jgi:predicted small integral membrane protein